MQLNNFGDLITLTKKRCNIETVSNFDSVITSALNQAYIELLKDDPQVSMTFAPTVNGVMTLPDDLDSIISISPEIKHLNRVGKYIYVDSDKTYTIHYTLVPEPLVEETDMPGISKKYWYIMSTFACYSYYLFKKKQAEVNAFLNEYLRSKSKAIPKANITSIEDVYGGVV